MKSRKEHILDESARLFRKKGYSGTSVQDIAEAVGIKAASLYNHIDSKQEILQALCLPISQSFSDGMKEIQNSTLLPDEKLEALVSLHLRLTLKYKDRMSLITGDWVHLDGESLKTYKKTRSEYESEFRSIINECKTKNLINPQIDTEISLFSILSSLHWLYSWRERHQEISTIELEKQLKKCLLQGLKS